MLQPRSLIIVAAFSLADAETALRRGALPRQQVLDSADVPLATPRGADAPSIQGLGNGAVGCRTRCLNSLDHRQYVRRERIRRPWLKWPGVLRGTYARAPARHGWRWRGS